jgi:hypothetical protein
MALHVTERPSCAGQPGVTFYLGEEHDAEQVAECLFGRRLAPAEYAGLAGAPDDAHVEVGTLDGGLYLEMYQPVIYGYHAVRLVQSAQSNRVIVNDGFWIARKWMQRRGLAVQVLDRQLRYAAALGIRRIETTAGRRPWENGYYAWPRLGFDGPLPLETRRNLPPELEHARSVLDLMESEPGRLWWRNHGTTTQVAFALTAGSRSWHVFRRYRNARWGLTLPPSRG